MLSGVRGKIHTSTGSAMELSSSSSSPCLHPLPPSRCWAQPGCQTAGNPPGAALTAFCSVPKGPGQESCPVRSAPSRRPHGELSCASRPGGCERDPGNRGGQCRQQPGLGCPRGERGAHPWRVPSARAVPGGGGCAPAGQPRAALARHGGWARHQHGAHVVPTWEPGRAPTALKPPFVPRQPLALGIQVVRGGVRRKPSNRVLGSARQRGTNAPGSAGRTGTKSSRPAEGAVPGPPPARARPRATARQEAPEERGVIPMWAQSHSLPLSSLNPHFTAQEPS